MISLLHTDAQMAQILKDAQVIAVVGYSDDPSRASYRIGQYLERMGYTVYPVNPTVDSINGQRSYPTLVDVPESIDIVNVFRRPEFLRGVVEEAIAIGAPVVWAQLGIADTEAARIGSEAGITVIMNRCIKVEHARLLR
jgi:predicted CoA-binding protein